MNIGELLLLKSKQDHLGHFYIIECHDSEEEGFKKLYSFITNFLSHYFSEIESQKNFPKKVQDHPDVFVMGNTPNDEEIQNNYFAVEDAAALNRFFEFKPLQSKRKFAIITQGHRISTVVANKWLKLLEEPIGNSTIFLLNPRGQKLLDTIHSRALHLRLSSPRNDINLEEWFAFLKSVKNKSLHQFLEDFSKAEKDLFYWNNLLVEWESIQEINASPKAALIEWLVEYQEMDTFHQPTATKWTLFYSYLNQHVLPRIP